MFFKITGPSLRPSGTGILSCIVIPALKRRPIFKAPLRGDIGALLATPDR